MKSWKTPTPEQVAKAVALLGHPQHYRYFFDRLENPLWVELLRSKGFFRDPPKPVLSEDEGTIRFPPWPESSYLARMAACTTEDDKARIAEVALAIPDTDNIAVHQDLVELAL